MDVGAEAALLYFIVIVVLWIVLPLIPAWLTFRITPDQNLGLKGPLQGMTLRATGSFAAYTIVAALLSVFVWPMGKFLIGKAAGDSLWEIKGRAELYDSEGKPVTKIPDLKTAYLKIVPDLNVIDTELSLKVPFPRGEKPIIYIEVPDWGGAKISLQDTESYTEDVVARKIELKDIVQIRQEPKIHLSVGEP